eukprot:CAMPEP_0168196986 /NCGR_PEP_ID=MMETSP0139_2-20121125/20878_1 /TAXON_ID=44445 /ORGANISM="Pseudo-nitzschia australis, Strain 10249 10 AB" /LENGTH=170 /DNA_ID=CAMNT_0008121337 /DNA_START=171 /DNA_END=683 /DNA_ORIENTATION=+
MLNPARKIYCVACFHRHPDLTPLTCDDDGSDYTDDEDDIDEYEKFPSTAERQEIIANAIPINDAIDSSEEILETQGEEDPFHKKIRRRLRRKKRMVAGGAAGGVACGIVGAVAGVALATPTLIVAGAVGGAIGTRIISKKKERLKDRRLVEERYMKASVTIGDTKIPSLS